MSACVSTDMSLEAAARELDKIETRMKQGVNNVSALLSVAPFSVKRMSQVLLLSVRVTPAALRADLLLCQRHFGFVTTCSSVWK